MRPIEIAVAVLLMACEPVVHDAPVTACDPIRGTGCGQNEVCRVTTDDVTLCLAPEVLVPGAPCTARSCAPGEACAQVEGAVRCWPVCELEGADCAEGGRCTWALGERWGLCAAPCRLGAVTDCLEPTHCGLSPPLPFTTCVRRGDAAVGEPCGPEAPCDGGSACLDEGEGPRCRVLCDDALVSCASGTACAGRIEGIDGIGYCAP
jgi:hypothetical protein